MPPQIVSPEGKLKSIMYFKTCKYLDKSFLGEFLVDFRAIGDVLSSVSIIQSGECLFKIALSRRYGGYDGRLGTTTQGVLQDTSQLAFSRRKKILKIKAFLVQAKCGTL